MEKPTQSDDQLVSEFQRALQSLIVEYLLRATPRSQAGMLASLVTESARGCARSGLPLDESVKGFELVYRLAAAEGGGRSDA